MFRLSKSGDSNLCKEIIQKSSAYVMLTVKSKVISGVFKLCLLYEILIESYERSEDCYRNLGDFFFKFFSGKS